VSLSAVLLAVAADQTPQTTAWAFAAYALAFVLLGGYTLRLIVAKRRRRAGSQDAP